MAGKGKRAPQPNPDADRERLALFAELAKRPDTVCPFLGLASARASYHDGITPEHRCYAFGEPSDLSAEQQNQVCLQRGYGNCPRYLRGVLVIPTEELAALRRQQPVAPNPVKPEETAAPAAAGKRRPPPRTAALLLVAAIALSGIGAGIFLLARGGVAMVPSPSPSPSVSVSSAPSLLPTATPVPTATATAVATPVGTPYPVTPPPDPTPAPGDQFVGFEVTVLDAADHIFRVSADGKLLEQFAPTFAQFAHLNVQRVIALSGLLHWRIDRGPYDGWSFVHDRSGPFQVRSIYRGSDGTLRYYVLPEDEI